MVHLIFSYDSKIILEYSRTFIFYNHRCHWVVSSSISLHSGPADFLKNVYLQVFKAIPGKKNKEISTYGFSSVLPDAVLDALFISLFHQSCDVVIMFLF